MGKIRIGRGSSMVTLDDELERGIATAIDQLVPGLRDRLEAEVEAIALGAMAAWPVKTGESKRAFDWGVRLPDPDHLEGFVVNTAEHSGKPYAYLVKGKAQGGKQSWKELVEKPAQVRIDGLADELAGVATAILNRK